MQHTHPKAEAQIPSFFSRRTYLQFMKRDHLRWARPCASFLGPLLLVACAGLSGATPETQVRQRATERWQALVGGDFNRAHSFNTPGFRAVVDANSFRGRIGNAGSWIGAEVVDVNCLEKAKCVARVRIDFKPVLSRRFGDKISTHTDETWLLEDGQWWIFQPI